MACRKLTPLASATSLLAPASLDAVPGHSGYLPVVSVVVPFCGLTDHICMCVCVRVCVCMYIYIYIYIYIFLCLI